jgi:hypothetical protein
MPVSEHRRSRRSWTTVVLAVLLLVVGCTTRDAPGAKPPQDDGRDDAAQVTTAVPAQSLTVVADADPQAAAVSASRALYRSAGVAVVAADGDAAGTLLGASAAVGLGVPLLLAGPGGLAADPVGGELDRLGVGSVLAVGDVPAEARDGGPEVVAVPARADAVAAAAGIRLAPTASVDDGGQAAAIAGLHLREPSALRPSGGTASAPSAPGQESRLPEFVRPRPLRSVVVLADGGSASPAAVATARAAGASVVVTGGTDPRASTDAIEALSADSTEAVVALGAGFAGAPDLGWQVDTARTGTQLPGGGQLLFPGRMLVALYGSLGSGALGVLGEQGLDATIERARQHAAAFDGLVDRPVVPAFEIIVTVASSAAGPDGNYSTELDPETIRPWVEAARDAGIYVVLDLQPGRADFLSQAKQYESLLASPNVGLALDPEWRLAPGQLPLQQIGSVGIDEVNGVVTWLAALTREQHLPQKLLVLHQFRISTLPGRERLDTSHPELAVMIHADGQGSQGDKQATWRALHEAPLPTGPLHWGWKNFYDEDHPMLTPQQTLDQVDPDPDLVTYQ